jgi:hypothetical protein
MKKVETRRANGERIRAGPHASWKSLKALSLAVLLVMVSSAAPRLEGESSNSSEYAVKAAFLFHFANSWNGLRTHLTRPIAL